jgi:hypothetical protein
VKKQMPFTVQNIRGIEPHPDTDPNETNVSKLIAVVNCTGTIGSELEDFPFGLIPSDGGVNANIVRAKLREWLDAGGVIPEWVPPEPTAEQIKDEAARRILEVAPEWYQRNLTARAAELAMKGADNWTAEEQAEVDAGQAIWDQIKAIRTASDAIEASPPASVADLETDPRWP